MLAVIDPRMPCSAKVRLKEICEVVELPPFSALDRRVASHPDMLVFKLGNKLFTSKAYYSEAYKYIDCIANHASLEIEITYDIFSPQYPHDVKFNVFTLCNALIGNTEYISSNIKEHTKKLGMKLTDVKQGYSRCSTVVLENAVITADRGIYNTARGIGADALLVSADGIALDGYNCGFIGGASGVCGNKVFFCGDITKHTDYGNISEFCLSHGYDVISLSDDPLYDVGTILFF